MPLASLTELLCIIWLHELELRKLSTFVFKTIEQRFFCFVFFYYCTPSLLTFIAWFLICEVLWKQIVRCHKGVTAGVGREAVWCCRVLPELCEPRLFALTHGSLHGPVTCDSREYRSFCFPILDLEYAFLTFVLHLQDICFTPAEVI